jgi:hypothetical protein
MTHLGAAAPNHLMNATVGNERGYFESVPFMHFHDALLTSAGSCWHDWRQLDTHWLASNQESLKADAKRLLEEEFGDAPLFVLKDPRMCRFIPFWLSVLGDVDISPRAVIPFRPPLEVIQSLRARDGFSTEKGALLWLRYVLVAERETRTVPRSFVAMDELLANWRKCARRIARDIDVAWPRFDDETSMKIDNFLTADLKHHNLESSEQHMACEWAARGYEALLILEKNPRSKFAREALDEVLDSFEQACTLIGPVVTELEAQTARLQSNVAALSVERDALIAASGKVPPTEAARAQTRDRLRELRAEALEVREVLEQLQNALPPKRLGKTKTACETQVATGNVHS